MKIKVFFFVGLSWAMFFSNVYVAAGESFILSKQTTKHKKLSKNEVKEALGQEIRDAFTIATTLVKQAGLCQIAACDVDDVVRARDVTAFEQHHKTIGLLHKNLGMLHVEVAAVQQTFTHLIERLIDNQKPFKKASRDTLNAALDVLRTVHHSLKRQEGNVRSLGKRLTAAAKKDGNLGNATVVASLKDVACVAVDSVKDIERRLTSCEGLKLS